MDRITAIVVVIGILAFFGFLGSISWNHAKCVETMKDKPAVEIRQICGRV